MASKYTVHPRDSSLSKETKRLLAKLSKTSGISHRQRSELKRQTKQACRNAQINRFAKSKEIVNDYKAPERVAGEAVRARQKLVIAPKVGRRNRAPIEKDWRPSIRPEGKIMEARRADDAPRGSRPPARKAVSTDTGKRKLQLSNQFSGGKILPHELLPASVRHIPLSLVTNRLRKDDGALGRADANALERERLWDDFRRAKSDMERMRQSLEAVEARGHAHGANRQKAAMRSEIASLLHEMKRIDSLLRCC